MTSGVTGETIAAGVSLESRRSAGSSMRENGTVGRMISGTEAVGRWLEMGLEAAVVVGLLVELVLVFTNVALRTVFGINYDWLQEVSPISLVFLTFVGGALSFRRGGHMRVHAGIQALPERVRPYFLSTADAIVFVVAVFLTQQSMQLLGQAGAQRMPMSGWSIAWMTAPEMVGMALMALFAFGQLFTYQPRVVLPSIALVVVALGLLLAFTGDAVVPDQALLITMVIFALLMAMSVPIGFVFTAITFLYLQQTKMAMLLVVPNTMQYGTSGFIILAIPFFIVAGLVMTEGGLAIPMSDAIACVIGRLRGGLLQVIVVAMYIFSGISGSKVADMVAVGSSLSAMLKREGYPKGETAAVLAASAAMGETVPPSVAMLVLSSVSAISVASLFVAGILPAVLIALCLMVAIYFRGGMIGIHGGTAIAWREVARKWIKAIPAFAMPIMLVAGILSGISTPTEVSTFAVVYGVIMAVLVYRSTSGGTLLRVMSESASMAGGILFITAAASAFSWALTAAQVPHRLMEVLSFFQGEPWLFMLAACAFLVIMGALLEGIPAILVLGTILLPIVPQFGFNSLQFAMVMIIGMGIGTFSPPIGIGLYFACTAAEATLEETVRPMLYYVPILLIGLLLVAFLPEVSLFLPRLAGVNIR
ncbi:MAG TPA: TRAP transporter large permease subunit [Chloroflexota bacterium]